MPHVQPEPLVALCRAIFAAAGAPDDIAERVARSLVHTNLLGHDSHGALKTMAYVGKIRDGSLAPTGRPQVERQFGATSVLDCHWSFGQVGAHEGAQQAIRQAQQFGIGAVALARVNHIGRLGEYAEQIARSGLIALVMTSGAMYGGQVAPFGGRERLFGTNPMAWAVPVGADRTPLVLDFATAYAAAGKVLVAQSKGVPLPEGCLLDRDGNPSTDPDDLDRGGMLLPFGSYKGSGLMLMIEIIPTLLAGFAPSSSDEFERGNPTLLLALSVEAFTERARFDRLVEELLGRVKRVKPLLGYDEVLLPGEPEARAYAERARIGIPIPDRTWADLAALARDLGVDAALYQGIA